jgi:hypothetical protein
LTESGKDCITNCLPISAAVKDKKKNEKKRSSSSRVCGKVGKTHFLSTFPQTIQSQKEKKEREIQSQPNHKNPGEENGEEKVKKTG